jgi:hypothetical protein
MFIAIISSTSVKKYPVFFELLIKSLYSDTKSLYSDIKSLYSDIKFIL